MHISGEARFSFNIIGFAVACDDCDWNVVAALVVAMQLELLCFYTLHAQARLHFACAA